MKLIQRAIMLLLFIFTAIHSYPAAPAKLRYVWVRDTTNELSQKLVFLKISQDTLYTITDTGLQKFLRGAGSFNVVKFPVAHINAVKYKDPSGPMPHIASAMGFTTATGFATGALIAGEEPDGYTVYAVATYSCLCGFLGVPIGLITGLRKYTMYINGDKDRLLALKERLK